MPDWGSAPPAPPPRNAAPNDTDKLTPNEGISFFGGFAGSMFFIPFGIAMSRGSMRSIEDPQHLARVLQQKMEKSRRDGKPLEPVHKPTADNNKTSWDAPITEAPLPSMADPTSSAQGWGDSTLEPESAPMPVGTGSGSRWEALRKDRTGTPSVWDNIRQQNAKEAHDTARRATPSTDTAPPSSGDAEYERSVREYYKAFERERQGVDTLSGFDAGATMRT